MYLCSATNNLIFKQSSYFTGISATNGAGVYTCATATTVNVNWDTFSTNNMRATQ